MGFAPMTVSVHDSDKEHAKALIELLRFERLMRSIEAGDAEVIDFVAGRNMQRLPSNEVLRLRREAVLYAMLPKPTENRIVALLIAPNPARTSHCAPAPARAHLT